MDVAAGLVAAGLSLRLNMPPKQTKGVRERKRERKSRERERESGAVAEFV